MAKINNRALQLSRLQIVEGLQIVLFVQIVLEYYLEALFVELFSKKEAQIE